MSESRWLDGNALAGVMAEIFGAEMTTALHGCGSCGARREVGAHPAYRGAGMVLRCPACGDPAMRITELPDGHLIHISGVWTFAMPHRG